MGNKQKIKESTPEALYLDRFINGSIGSLKTSKLNIFEPRGDHAKDAFDKALSDEIKATIDFGYFD